MIDFTKITEEELKELKDIILKNTEKSELERFYLFDNNPYNTTKVFLLCRRFLESAHNIVEDGELKNQLILTLTDTKDISEQMFRYVDEINRINFGKRHFEVKLKFLAKDEKVTELIDVFSILLERANIIRISRLKGVVIEGQSGVNAKKMFPGDFHAI